MNFQLIKRIADKIKDVGWQGVPLVIKNQTTDLSHRLYINHVLHSPLLGGRFPPFKQPSILMVSHPRSGSSWISNLLGMSPDAAFMWEPVTIPFLAKTNKHFYVPDEQDPDLGLFTQLSDQAFLGLPPKNCHRTIARMADFWNANRKNSHVFIKEINPRATAFYMTRYAPKLIVLLRHPAAVADSHERLGFIHNLAEFENFGYHYGMVLSEAIASATTDNSIVVEFEAFAEDPRAEFMRLFAWLGFRLPNDFEKIIEEYCHNPQQVAFPGQLKRVSRNEKDKWRKRLAPEKIEALMKGYFRSPLPHYRDEAWL